MDNQPSDGQTQAHQMTEDWYDSYTIRVEGGTLAAMRQVSAHILAHPDGVDQYTLAAAEHLLDAQARIRRDAKHTPIDAPPPTPKRKPRRRKRKK